jgi:hypothetical protein
MGLKSFAKFTQRKIYAISTYTELDHYRIYLRCKGSIQRCYPIENTFFGCSTGEEIFIKTVYFQLLLSLGVDIIKWCIRQCKINENNILTSTF